jgi:hypothetical protein
VTSLADVVEKAFSNLVLRLANVLVVRRSQGTNADIRLLHERNNRGKKKLTWEARNAHTASALFCPSTGHAYPLKSEKSV